MTEDNHIRPDLRVLLVSDSSLDRSGLRDFFARQGIAHIEEVKTGESALKKLNESQYDLIISSQTLPGARGVDLLQVVRYSPTRASTPFIIIATDADRTEFLNAIEFGATDYIVRPFTIETLEHCIPRALRPQQKAFVEWGEKYSVGILVIDEQHKRLIKLINELHKSMLLGRSKEIVSWVLDELVDYTKTHFKTEEELLTKYNYPELAVHCALHRVLTGQAIELQDKMSGSSKIGIAVETMQFMQKWLTDHILGTDKRYSNFLREHFLREQGVN